MTGPTHCCLKARLDRPNKWLNKYPCSGRPSTFIPWRKQFRCKSHLQQGNIARGTTNPWVSEQETKPSSHVLCQATQNSAIINRFVGVSLFLLLITFSTPGAPPSHPCPPAPFDKPSSGNLCGSWRDQTSKSKHWETQCDNCWKHLCSYGNIVKRCSVDCNLHHCHKSSPGDNIVWASTTTSVRMILLGALGLLLLPQHVPLLQHGLQLTVPDLYCNGWFPKTFSIGSHNIGCSVENNAI